MKIRNLPYGYQYVDGAIVVQHQEQRILHVICETYLKGESLLGIAKILNEQGVEYMPGVVGWNKARLKRILEDERYLGGDRYPAILDEEQYNALQAVKNERNTQKAVDRAADIFQINIPIRCPDCSGIMHRSNDPRRKCAQRWICKNNNCRKRVAKSDEEFLSEITNLLNRIIASPDMIQDSMKMGIEQSIEIQQLNHEIESMLSGLYLDKSALRKKMLARVSLQYQGIDPEPYITKQLRADFANADPLSAFSAELFDRTVKTICVEKNGSVSIILVNNQRIRKDS